MTVTDLPPREVSGEPDLPPSLAARYAELTQRAQGLAGRRRLAGPQVLLAVGAVATGLGLLLVVLGWLGASRTIYVFEQLPYLISGGILGGTLVVAGGFSYFGYWLVRSHTQQQRTADTLERVEALLERLVAGEGR